MTDASRTPRRTNRLARQKSPYLLQHQHNPVDWYPWGEEAFSKARTEQKPIFLSIGYSTCHWCHVMERESFEDEAIALFLNEHFVSIKVDREERPDVDRIYMAFVQATTGQGGWPLSVFLTPDLKPFFGGTYFPPAPRFDKPSLMKVLTRIQKLWAGRRDELLSSADDAVRQLQASEVATEPANHNTLTPDVLRAAAGQLQAGYDPVNGGFGGAPKFPHPSQQIFLLNYGLAHGVQDAVRMVLHTCDRMAAGGIHDQLGGGFARYATDAQWLVPHFEKMLYDNALLVRLYLQAYQVSGATRYADTARDTLDYVLRDMTDPEGGFYAAEDADSEGKEGKFYGWTLDEFKALLTPDELALALRYYGVTHGGNFKDRDGRDTLTGLNVLSVCQPELRPGEDTLLSAAKAKLLVARGHRVRPRRDDKILASWNGLMLGAFAQAGVVLGERAYLDAAGRNLDCLRERLWDTARGTLSHRWRDGERDEVQLLSGYSFLLSGVLDFYEASLDVDALVFALELADAMMERFYDRAQGGFWQRAGECSDLILRSKEEYDGAEPSGNSVAVVSLLRLAEITGRSDLATAAERTLALYAGRLRSIPATLPCLLLAAAARLTPHPTVVIAGYTESPEGLELLRAAHAVYRPFKTVLGTQGPVFAFARTLHAVDGHPAAYVCAGQACRPPVTAPDGLRRALAVEQR
ncbi:MAG: thioredoxin domain-containing protein [Kiritimatiellae bacterium]|nr:thioredoxin domain-containing protein [Kiritimatiellia bacterium]